MTSSIEARVRRLEKRVNEQDDSLVTAVLNGTATLRQYARGCPQAIELRRMDLVVASPILMERVRTGVPTHDTDIHLLAVAFPPDNELPDVVKRALERERSWVRRTSPELLKLWTGRVSEILARELSDPLARLHLAELILALGAEPDAMALRRELYEDRDGRWVNIASELAGPEEFKEHSGCLLDLEISVPTLHADPPPREFYPEWSDVVKGGQHDRAHGSDIE